MKFTAKYTLLLTLIAACGGCALQTEGPSDPLVSSSDRNASACISDAAERVYRNQFLRARRIGQACTE